MIDLGITNQAVVISMSETSSTEKIKKSEIKESNIIEVALGRVDELTKVTSRPCIDLILAAPRPLRLERIIPVASCLGVRRIAIIGAAKVEKDYFGNQRYSITSARLFLLQLWYIYIYAVCNITESQVHS